MFLLRAFCSIQFVKHAFVTVNFAYRVLKLLILYTCLALLGGVFYVDVLHHTENANGTRSKIKTGSVDFSIPAFYLQSPFLSPVARLKCGVLVRE